MRKYTAILTFLFLFLFVGSVNADYIGTIDTWNNTLTVVERTWSELDTWDNTLTVTPESEWSELDTWDNTLIVVEEYVPPEPPTYYHQYVIAEAPSSGTTKIYSFLQGNNAVYNTAQTVLDSGSFDSYMELGQIYSDNTYKVKRGYLVFDLTDVSDDITGATLWLTGITDSSATNFIMELRAFTGSSLAFDNATFNGYGASIFAEFSSEDFSSDTKGMEAHLSSSGVTYLNDHKGELCYFMLVSDRDMDSETPTGYEFISIKSGSTSNAEATRPTLGLQYETSWTELDTWDNTLTVTSAGSWSELDTWDNTLTVGEETPTPVEPLVDYDTLITKILMPFILLFLIAFVLGQEFGAVGFIVGAMIGLFLVWMITGISFGLVLLGLFVLAAIWWRM